MNTDRAVERRWTLLVMLAAVLAVAPSAAEVSESDESLPTGVSQDWWTGVQKEIRDSEYHVTWQGRTELEGIPAAWHAPNRAHDFRIYFTRAGIRVIPRTRQASSWEWGLSLIGYGRGGRVWPVNGADLSPEDNRIEYDRGGIVEWYVSDRRGLEQGFTLSAPPGSGAVGNAASKPGSRHAASKRPGSVYLVLALTGNLSPRIGAGGQVIDFVLPGGRCAVRYAHLNVEDARGTQLSAWMEGFAGAGVRGIRLVIDDRNAAYPLTVDPLATSPAWTAEGDQAGASLGASVATAGDVNGDGFSDVIVGADWYDNGEADEGRAYVYQGSGAGLPAVPAWTAEGDQTFAFFGGSVGTAGDVNGDGFSDVLVGASQYDNGENDEGMAFVYHGSGAGLSSSPDWTAEGDQVAAYFGNAVATAGDVNGDDFSDVIVSAPGYDNGEPDEGWVFVYHGNSAGLPTSADWTEENDIASASFGESVATAGDVNGDGFSDIVIGTPSHDNGETDEGMASVYHGSSTGLSTSPDWTAESDLDLANFGWSVGTAGDVDGDGYADLIIGCFSYSSPEASEGAVFVYHGSPAGPSGAPVATLGDADWTAESDWVQAHFGASVGTAGDINGDGYADVIVGATEYTNGEISEGAAFAYFGSGSGLDLGGTRPSGDLTNADWAMEGEQASAGFGSSVSTAGDVDGDGYAEVIVGAPGYQGGVCSGNSSVVCHGNADCQGTCVGVTCDNDPGTSCASDPDCDFGTCSDAGEGAAYVYHGSAAGPSGGPQATPADADWTAEGNQSVVGFGQSIATAGDVNGDGMADVIIGAPFYDNGQTDEGKAWVYRGTPAGLSTSFSWEAESDSSFAKFGDSVAAAGDVNGDGFSDVIVGAPGYGSSPLETNEGSAYLFHGSSSGLSATSAWYKESDQESANFGWSVGTAGDVNGDGYADVIVGAYGYEDSPSEEGWVFAYYGSKNGISTSADWTAEGNSTNAHFGWSVGTAGDVNRDGYTDLIVGAFEYSNVEGSEGAASVFFGSPTGLDLNGTRATGDISNADWTAESNQVGAKLGSSVSTAGDVNGDGYADVIVGAPYYEAGVCSLNSNVLCHDTSDCVGQCVGPTCDNDPSVSCTTAANCNFGVCNDVVGDGMVFVYHGSPDGPSGQPQAIPQEADWTAQSDQVAADFGASVATAGDVNGDGYADVVVGAQWYDNDHGSAFVYQGSSAGLSGGPDAGTADADWTATSDQATVGFGICVASAGDVNGDGYAEVIVGAERYENDQLNEGMVFAYYGNEGAGMSLRPEQRRTTDIAPIDHLGASDAPDRFRLAMLGRTPFGRGRVTLEREVKPLAALLSGIDTAVGVQYYDTRIDGVDLNELTTGLFTGVCDGNDDVVCGEDADCQGQCVGLPGPAWCDNDPSITCTTGTDCDFGPCNHHQAAYHWRARLRYHQAATPFAQRSRWLTRPWNGWQEADLRTGDPAAAGKVPTEYSGPEHPLLLDKEPWPKITLTWYASCLETDTDYAIYEGTLGDFTSHEPRYCSTGGLTEKTFTPLAGDTYYLVVPLNSTREGSYGKDRNGAQTLERPQGSIACLPQQIGTCP